MDLKRIIVSMIALNIGLGAAFYFTQEQTAFAALYALGIHFYMVKHPRISDATWFIFAALASVGLGRSF